MSGRHGRGRGKFTSRMYSDDDKPRFGFTLNRSKAIIRRPQRPHRVDEDVAMDGEQPRSNREFQNRGGFRGGKRGRRWEKRIQNQSGNHSFGPGWHKVTVLNGSPYERDFILNTIASLCPAPFYPVAYAKLGVNSVFYVDGKTLAEGVASCSGKFSGPDAQPVNLKVDAHGPPPTATIDDKVKGIIKEALLKRYNPVSSNPTLILSNFPASPEFVMDYYIPLFRPTVVTTVFNLLDEILPHLVALDLSNNRLTTLEAYAKLPQLAPNLKAINLSDNKLRELFLLEKIKGLHLLELNLDKNPLKDKYPNREEYVRVVHKYFPKVTKLDGLDEVPPVIFDLEEDRKLIPPFKRSFTCSDEASKIVSTFVEEYFKIYDSDNRQPLLEAYHESAIFTLQCSYMRPGIPGGDPPGSKLSSYLTEARNLIRNQDASRLERNSHQGKLDVVAFLARLPKTKHDLHGFNIDLTLAVAGMINFAVTGCFKERGGEREMHLRYFHRTFILVPQNSGFVIVNEMLFITNATTDQYKCAFTASAPTPVPSPSGPSTSSSLDLPNIPSLSLTSDMDKRRAMIQQFSKDSTMNEAWSEKCLDQNGWDYNKSAQVFTELQKNGSIPAEAFVKVDRS